MKKWIALLLTLTLAVGLAGCGGGPQDAGTPEGALSAMLEGYKAGKDVNDYFTGEGVETDMLEDEEMADFVKLIRDISQKLTYNIENSVTEGSEAVVTVSITNKNTTAIMGDFIADYMAAALAEAFANMGSDDELSDERIAEIANEITLSMKEKYKDGSGLETFTVEVEVAMVRDGEKWLVDSDERDELTFAMMGFEAEGWESIFGGW